MTTAIRLHMFGAQKTLTKSYAHITYNVETHTKSTISACALHTETMHLPKVTHARHRQAQDTNTLITKTYIPQCACTFY